MVENIENIYKDCILPLDTATIRVLDLKPGRERDEIEGSLRVIDIAANPDPQYTCLSYVWGDPKVLRPAIINGQHIQITKNLYDALVHIRSRSEVLVTWADAICINQFDIDEKSRQVALMTKVYRQCLKVYIWLGVPDGRSLTGSPFEFLDHFAQGKHFYELPGFYLDKLTGRLTWELNEDCDNMLNNLLQIVESPWWSRAWTVQEGILPRDSVLIFGVWTTTWDYLIGAIDKKNSHGNGSKSCCEDALKAFNPHRRFIIEEWLWQPGWMARFRDILQGKRQPQAFHRSLLFFTSRQCKLHHDKIYSMLSLATHSQYSDFKPDYRKNLSVVYTEIFTRMVHEVNDNFICFMGGGFGSSQPKLPSWVRDFSQIREPGVVAGEDKRMDFITLYNASNMPSSPVSWDENEQLHYKGTYADKVKIVGPPMYTSNTDFGGILRQWFELCKEILRPCEATTIRNTFSKVICGDVCEDGARGFRRARHTDFPQQETFCRLLTGDINALDMQAFGGGVNASIWGRCFFATYSGRMGLCYPNVLSGDEVWIMRGMQVPFIVRPLERADVGYAGKYSLCGDCYLNKIMDKELSEEEKCMERLIVIA